LIFNAAIARSMTMVKISVPKQNVVSTIKKLAIGRRTVKTQKTIPTIGAGVVAS